MSTFNVFHISPIYWVVLKGLVMILELLRIKKCHLKHTELICNYVFTLKTENLIEFNQLDHLKQV